MCSSKDQRSQTGAHRGWARYGSIVASRVRPGRGIYLGNKWGHRSWDQTRAGNAPTPELLPLGYELILIYVSLVTEHHVRKHIYFDLRVILFTEYLYFKIFTKLQPLRHFDCSATLGASDLCQSMTSI